MGVFRQFPYSNFHEMNLDEIIKIVKNLAEEWVAYQLEWDNLYTDTQQALEDFKNYAYSYFDNLDVQDEINNKINSLVADGTFNAIVMPTLSTVVTTWLTEHITEPTGVVIDTSLTVEGAVADAKATGDAIKVVADDVTDIENVLGGEIIVFSDTDYASASIQGNEYLITLTGLTLFANMAYPEYVNASLDGFYIRDLASLPSVIGLIFGKDNQENYYFLTVSATGSGDIYQVTPNGVYTKVIENNYPGSGFTKIEVVSLANGRLTFNIYNSLGLIETTQIRDVSSYNLTPCVGFIPYTTSAFTFYVPKANFYTFYKVEGAYNDIAEIQKVYKTRDVVLSDKRKASVNISGSVAEITISNTNLFVNDTPIYTNANIKNYYIDGITSFPSILGVVFGKDASNNYYYLSISSTDIGQVFRVTPTGAYTRIDDQIYSGSGFAKVVFNGIENNYLSYRIYNTLGDVKKVDLRDISSYGIVEETVGFIAYTAGTYTFDTPRANYNSYKNFATISDLNEMTYNCIDQLLPLLVNTTTNYKIKLIGDSITAGYGGTGYNDTISGGGDLIVNNRYQNIAGTCWANSLKAYLEDKFAGVTVINNGYSGATAEFLYNNISSFVSSDDNLVICMVGTNNRNNSGDLNRLYTNLQNIVSYMAQLDIPLILMSSIPASIANEESVTVLHMEDVNMIVGAVARKNKVPWISVFDLMKEYLKYTGTSLDSLLTDGMHPNDSGYAVMFELISNALNFTTPIPGYTWTPAVISHA